MKKLLLSLSFGITFLVAGAQSEPTLALNKDAVSNDVSFSNSDAMTFEFTGGEVDNTPVFTFYPNPVKDYLNIKFKERGNYTVRIYNIVGVKVREEKTHDNDLIKINLSEISKGMYFISYEPGDGKVITKTFTKDQ
ncbi:MAG: T9SS type A sorting domain-containing protein [Bacteroidetes bacterium]|nr:T9SS type A sorting domain-containing protein [Bacteroidota bacterium]